MPALVLFGLSLPNARPLQQAGLWTNYRTSPTYTGTDIDTFVQACTRYSAILRNTFRDAEAAMEYVDPNEPFVANGVPATELSPLELNEMLETSE